MKKRYVIRQDNLPMRSPLLATLLAWLVMERLSSPEWVWGAIGLFLAIIWIVWFIDLFKTRPLDLIEPKRKNTP